MNIQKSIKKIYPELEFDKDFIVFDNSDGKGQQIKWLNKKVKQPTKAQLEKAWVEVEKEIKEKEDKKENEKQLVEKLGGENEFNALVKFVNVLATDYAEKFPESKTAELLKMVNTTLNKE